jgi:hypothetical protein
MLDFRFETFCCKKKGVAMLFLFSIVSFHAMCLNLKKNEFKNEPKSHISSGYAPRSTHISLHAFHTSITQIEYNSKAKNYEISVRIFTDDFETVINTENKTKSTKIQDGDKNDGLVSTYVLKHFSIISPQNKKISLKYIGKENEDIATWLYFEMPEESFVKGSKIQQNVLMELFEDQVNIVNVRKGEERKSFLFDLKNKSKIFE